MGEQESGSGDDPPLVTPKMFVAVIRGKGTAKEREVVQKALDDPHSVLHDWLEGMEQWAEQTFHRETASSQAAKRVFADAIARQRHQDAIAETVYRRAHPLARKPGSCPDQ